MMNKYYTYTFKFPVLNQLLIGSLVYLLYFEELNKKK